MIVKFKLVVDVDAKDLQMRSYGNDGIFTPIGRFVLCLTLDNGLVFWIVSFETVHVVSFVYQRKIWADFPFHLGTLDMGIAHLRVVSVAGKIALFRNIK